MEDIEDMKVLAELCKEAGNGKADQLRTVMAVTGKPLSEAGELWLQLHRPGLLNGRNDGYHEEMTK